jgi:hypothetical protein
MYQRNAECTSVDGAGARINFCGASLASQLWLRSRGRSWGGNSLLGATWSRWNDLWLFVVRRNPRVATAAAVFVFVVVAVADGVALCSILYSVPSAISMTRT